MLMRHVAVREHDIVDRQFPDQVCEFGLGINRDACRIMRTRERRWISTRRNARYLGGGKRDYAIARVSAKAHVEIVKIAAGRPEDNDFARCVHVHP